MKDIVVTKESFDFDDFLEKNKEYIFLLLIYVAGLLAGSLLFKSLDLSKYSSYV